MLLPVICLLPFFITVQSEIDDGTLVQIESGTIRGHILQSVNGNNFWAFQEIPYASPPIKENRYQLPKPPKSWSEVLNATKNTKICYQANSRFPNLEVSEDCLYINVYTPIKSGSNEFIPVLLWVHSGGFSLESGAYEYYGPKYIIDEGVVVVTFNYRLGPFGFLATEDGVIPPGIGLEDQKYAFKWVKRNIHLFGGDVNKVTLVGESAGSISIGHHLIGPWENNEELFHAVVMQSGSVLGGNPSLITNATIIALELAQKIDPTFTPSSTKELLQFLQKVSAEDIQKYGISEKIVRNPKSTGVLEEFMKGNFKKVPVLIGFTSEELLFARLNINDTLLSALDADPSTLIFKGINMSPENRKLAGELYKDLYTKNTSFVKNHAAYIRHTTDSAFITPMCKQTELAASKMPHYLYQFSYKGPLGGQMNLQPLPGTGAVVHTEDLHYMWEETGFNSDLNEFPDADVLTMRRFIRMWTNFVKYHNPTPVADPLLDNITWPATGSNNLVYLNFNSSLNILVDPKQNRRVREVIDDYMEAPYLFYQ